jgi:hypothetical protein
MPLGDYGRSESCKLGVAGCEFFWAPDWSIGSALCCEGRIGFEFFRCVWYCIEVKD